MPGEDLDLARRAGSTVSKTKSLGFGLGLRPNHYQHVIERKPAIDWFEVISENFMVDGGKPRYYLDEIRKHYPLALHGVSLSIGSTDPLDRDYLRALKQLAQDIEPVWISDHLCWTSVGGVNSHDLLPLPYNEAALVHVVERVDQVQEALGRRILLENVSSYLSYTFDEMKEWEFLSEVARRADCLLLLDVNNIYVSSRNHDFDPTEYIRNIDPDRVQQIHLAGHTDNGDHLIDTHDHDVPDPVWDLYRYCLGKIGPVSTMIERDDDIPQFESLEAELNLARSIAQELLP